MSTVLFFLPPVAAVIILLIAIKSGFNKNAFVVAAFITMGISALFFRDASWYEMLCAVTLPLAISYVAICLFLSVKERNNKDESDQQSETELHSEQEEE